MAEFTSTAPLNLRWRSTNGSIVEIAQGAATSRSPWPANTPFAVPDELADEFEAAFTAPPDEVPLRRYWPAVVGPPAYAAGVASPGPQPREGRIPGLTRL